MIDRVILTDFQRHARLSLTLGPGVTTIVGPSDAGKSAVFRAIRWACLNAPAGAGFVRQGTDTVSVAVRADGRWVVRRRGPKENAYELDGEPYVSLRAPSVPAAIADLLKVDVVNFQAQHDPPFWLLDTPGTVSRAMNEMIDLGEIDAVMAEAAAAVRRTKAVVEVSESRLTAAQAAAARTAWATAFDAALTVVEGISAEWDRVRADVVVLGGILADVDRLTARGKRSTSAADAGETLLNTATTAVHTASNRFTLAGILDDIDRHAARLAADPTPAFDDLKVVRARGDAVAADRGELEAIVDEIHKLEERLCLTERELTEAGAELTRAAAAGCPVCGRPASPSQLLSATPTSGPSAPQPVASRRGGLVSRPPTLSKSRP